MSRRRAPRVTTPRRRARRRLPWRRRGATLVEVLVALTLVAIQVPALVATIGAAAALSHRADAILATIDAASDARCRTP